MAQLKESVEIENAALEAKKASAEAEVAGTTVVPRPWTAGTYNYLQLAHELAPTLKLNKSFKTKNIRLSPPGSTARALEEQRAAREAAEWTKAIRNYLAETHSVYVVDVSQKNFSHLNPAHQHTHPPSSEHIAANSGQDPQNLQNKTLWADKSGAVVVRSSTSTPEV